VSLFRKHLGACRVQIVLLALSALHLAKPAPLPAPPPRPDPNLLRVGVWIESRPGLDSSAGHRWAFDLVARLDRLVSPPPSGQHAVLAHIVSLPPGRLPLAGGDPRHHPDLRASDLDLVWGVPAQDSLSPALAQRILRTWLTNRGCLDERGFVVGWDLFHLPRTASNGLDSNEFPIDARNSVHWPRWTLALDPELTESCRRALALHPAGSGPSLSDHVRHRLETELRLRKPLTPRLTDALGHPAVGALLEIWRGRPDPRRPYASLFSGMPDTSRSDEEGRFPLASPLAWFSDSARWVHGSNGSNGVSYWRITHGPRKLSGWMDAEEMLSLPLVADTLRLEWALPSGTSRAWKEAAEHWPYPWLAAETDSTGRLVLGLSAPTPLSCVLRLIDSKGRETARTPPLTFPTGVHERRFDLTPGPGDWDVRLDAPSSRLQVRLGHGEIAPPTRP